MISPFGFVLSVIFLLLKVFAVGVFATISWWLVALPVIIAIVIDILLFAVLGFSVFRMFDKHW